MAGRTRTDPAPSDRKTFWLLALIAIVVPFGWLLLLCWSPLRRALQARRDRESS